MADNLWNYTTASNHRSGTDLIGYRVEATDGGIGKVDRHSDDVGSSYLVVDTGPWIFGKRVLLPAGLVTTVDIPSEMIFVACTRDEIKNAPEFEQDRHAEDTGYRDQLGLYYGPFLG
ncbi:PRC-barrel domain containing protein [Streptomyces sp. NPDC047108]|uniref:PRC-barrel domain containing protein n=1 Tax=Streptomyces sp. NPDC047108 TaxID=3155025 RepID=UPI0033F050A9